MVGIVIVGAGECGTRAAFSARAAGYDGPVTLISAEEQTPYERPPLSKPSGAAVTTREICTHAQLSEAGIDYLPGVSARSLDPAAHRLSLSTGGTLDFDRLLLATGAAPRALPCAGGARAQLFRSMADAETTFAAAETSRHILIAGAGLIGLELAASLRAKGAEVTVVEMADRALSRAVPAPMADRLVARHRAEGVTLLFGCGVRAIHEGSVTLANGCNLPGDLVIAAIGVTPNTGLAETAGLAVGNGIRVDTQLRTSAANIYAAGDCASLQQPDGSVRRYESWRSAQRQGEVAGRNLAGGSESFGDLPWFWSNQYDLGLQVVGEANGTPIVRQIAADTEIHFFVDTQGRLAAAAGLGPGQTVAKDIKIAEKIIAAGLRADPAALADPAHGLKAMLKRAIAA